MCGLRLREIRLTPNPIASLCSPFPFVGCSCLSPEDNWGLGFGYRFAVFWGVDPPEVCLGALDSVPGLPGATSARRRPGPLVLYCFSSRAWGSSRRRSHTSTPERPWALVGDRYRDLLVPPASSWDGFWDILVP